VTIGGEIVFRDMEIRKGYPGYGPNHPCIKFEIEDFPKNRINVLLFNENAVDFYNNFKAGDYIVVTGKVSQSKVRKDDFNIIGEHISLPTKYHNDYLEKQKELTTDADIEDLMKY
jgi:aspartyl/asparaginyl-tRNA synthetase